MDEYGSQPGTMRTLSNDNEPDDLVQIGDYEYENISLSEEVKMVQELESIVAIVVPIVFSVLIFVGFFGNLLVVMVVALNRHMRNTTNLLILNLAVADILFIVFCVPFTTTSYALPHNWPFGDFW